MKLKNMEMNNESSASIFLKKSLIMLKFKKSLLKRVVEDKTFVNKNSEMRTPHKRYYKKYTIQKEICNNRNVFILAPKNKPENKLILLYLHGGAFMANFLPIHWNFISKLIDKTGATIIAPDYPLSPEYNWSDAFELFESLDKKILLNYENIIFMGDSAGAGLALSWSMNHKVFNKKLPKRLILLSPWLDLSMENPKITEIEKLDPYLSKEALLIAGNYWSGNKNIKSWQVSPIYGEFEGVPPITIFTGTADILNPDSRALKDNLSGLGIDVDFREYDNMMHDWMFFNIPEARKCHEEIVDLLVNK